MCADDDDDDDRDGDGDDGSWWGKGQMRGSLFDMPNDNREPKNRKDILI